MEEQIKFKGIKKAVGDFNRWVGCAIIYLDKEDKVVWCNVYPDENSYDEYKDNIIPITRKGTSMSTKLRTTTMKRLKELCQIAVI